MKRTDLTQRLDLYRRTARGLLALRKSGRMKTLATLTAAGSAAFAMTALPAYGAIQYHELNMAMTNPGANSSRYRYFDLDGDLNYDIRLYWRRSGTTWRTGVVSM